MSSQGAVKTQVVACIFCIMVIASAVPVSRINLEKNNGVEVCPVIWARSQLPGSRYLLRPMCRYDGSFPSALNFQDLQNSGRFACKTVYAKHYRGEIIENGCKLFKTM
uniref:Uncharacterized LOC100185563 n=1 Tax=Ciona intestinalis TaxID=7719 RepID=F6U9M5_CIOIN|nr:uncharacterized protein LOC100185563 [Ciona intestinalis]|eukprot:XP_002131401.1 uncharacterized protein LOC100185563 [Ciona intestinalis]